MSEVSGSVMAARGSVSGGCCAWEERTSLLPGLVARSRWRGLELGCVGHPATAVSDVGSAGDWVESHPPDLPLLTAAAGCGYVYC